MEVDDSNNDADSEVLGTTVAGSGEGFNTLAGYLFGNNTSERSMSMTTPVNIDVSPQTGRWVCYVSMHWF